MEISKELLEKAQQAQNAEDLLKIAGEAGYTLSPDTAEKYYRYLQGGDDLPDEALEIIAGGKGSNEPTPKYRIGQKLILGWRTTPETVPVTVRSYMYYDKESGWKYDLYRRDDGGFMHEWLEKRDCVYYDD